MPAAVLVRFAIVSLITLATLLPGTTLAVAPTRETIPIDNIRTFPAGTWCSFPVVRHIEGFVRITTFVNQDGAVVREQESVHLHGTFTNPASGKSLAFTVAETDRVTTSADGGETVSTTGLIGRLTVPGVGLITADVGRLVLRFTPDRDEPEVLFEAGRHDPSPIAVLCQYLA